MGAGFFGVFMVVQVNESHVRTFACKQHRHRPANARIATGDQGGKATKLAAGLLVRCLEAGFELHVSFQPGLAQVLLRHG